MSITRYDDYSEILQSEDGVAYESGLPFMDLLYDGDIVWHKVVESENGRPDLIAYKYFKDPSFWYVIVMFNSIQDPLSICSGDSLAIPINAQSGVTYMPFTYS